MKTKLPIKLIVTTIFLLFGVSGCTTAGTRTLTIEASNEKCEIQYSSGSNLQGGIKGRATLDRDWGGSCKASADFYGDSSDPTAGHEATVSVVKESLTTLKSAADAYTTGPGTGQRPLSAGSSGARRGIAP